MPGVIPRFEEINPRNFRQLFHHILEVKQKADFPSVSDNPPDLLERAKQYGIRYHNNSWGWASNVWSRSPANTVIVDRDDEVKDEHRVLLLRVLEHVLAQGPLIKVDGYLGQPGTKVQMHTTVYVDPQFPDIAYRWRQLVFPAPPEEKPDVEIFAIPHYLGNPRISGTDRMLMVLRFPHQGFTVITASSYQGEVKKAALTHWIHHVYRKGCTGEHAALREFDVKTVGGGWRRAVAGFWGISGSGKSTHGMYVWTKNNVGKYVEKFGINPLDFVREQKIRNDDIIAIDSDKVYGSERGSWTKTEDLLPDQEAMWNAAMSPRALHEDTEFDEKGNPSFRGEVFQYFGLLNKNSRSVIYLEDTGYFDGNINSSGPLTTAVFLSPGYFTDYPWVKLVDSAFAARALTDGRTVGHQAQGRESIGKVRFVPRYSEFTMGVSHTAHVERFYQYLKKREERGNPIEVYQFNTTGQIVAEYRWVEAKFGDKSLTIPEPRLVEVDGGYKVVGGTRPSIEETELFLLQASRGAVRWKSHPVWGGKVLIPAEVPGIKPERLRELEPTSHLEDGEFRALLKSQVEQSKYWLQKNCPEISSEIHGAMDLM